MKKALAAVTLWGIAPLAQAQAPEAVPEERPTRYVLGVSITSRPEYDGAATRATKLRPLWAV
ncbi:hypothetical protein DBR42_11370, partial [Pelomonas sp. HMWF004]